MFGKSFTRSSILAAAGTAIALAAVTVAAASGPNLVSNGTFAANINGWTPANAPDVQFSWVAGTAQVTNIVNSTGNPAGVIWQCVGAAGPGTYTLSGDVFVPSGQARKGFGALEVTFFSGPNCGGGNIGALGIQSGTQNQWVSKSSLATAPAGTVSARVGINSVKLPTTFGGTATDPFTARFDNISLTLEAAAPPPPPAPTGTPAPATPAPTRTPPPDHVGTPTPPPPSTTPPPATTPPPVIPCIPCFLGGSDPTPPSTPPVVKTTPAPQQPGTTPPQPPLEQVRTHEAPPASTPLPPNTGTGSSDGSGHGFAFATLLGLLMLGGAAVTATFASRRSS